MKSGDSYKGFETWFNGIRMRVKMYLYVFFIFLGVQIVLTIVASYFFHGDVYAAFLGYLKAAVNPSSAVAFLC